MNAYNSWLRKGTIDVSTNNGLSAENDIHDMVKTWMLEDMDRMGLPPMAQFACTGQVPWCIYDPSNAQLVVTPTSPDRIISLVQTLGTFGSMVLIFRTGNELKVYYGQIAELAGIRPDIAKRFMDAELKMKEGA